MTLKPARRTTRAEHDLPPAEPAVPIGGPEGGGSASRLDFRIGIAGAFIAPGIFLAGVVAFFVVFGVFDMNALTASGLAGILVAGLFARSYSRFWEHIIAGVSSRNSVSLLLILLVVSMVAAMITQSDVAGGFVWLAGQIGIGGGLFAAVTFVLTCVISMSTGTSFGTMFTAFPIFYPAGVLLGADPVLLAGAILSGAIFGDNLAPISDSTIVSASTQRYRRREGIAEIGGVVRSRAPYALVAAGISAILFLVFGLVLSGGGASGAVAGADGDPLSLVMVVPVVLLLGVAFWKRDIFLAATVGLLSGIVIGLVTGLMTPPDIISVGEDGAPGGLLVAGVGDMLPLVGLAIVIFAIVGILQGAGVFDLVVDLVERSEQSAGPVKSELVMGIGAATSAALFAGVNSPSMLMFGPVADKLGAKAQLHPYRRANIMDGFTLGIGAVVPVASVFLLIASQLTQGYGEGVPVLSAFSIFTTSFYPLLLTAVMLVAVLTGWGRRFEGEGGVAVRQRPAVAEPPAPVSPPAP
ncbi:Na+/H+ antiporter NhaC family protein [Labedella endophytica]|uniref:Na+/H+ antiporter NhaC family protein n=1 Tax=Labedella endophytica TaxID=1523160 RepID=A0A3S0VDG9_9MICO|nr:Na+/H+ antiporter NhaC family protein [Labedella endophytica]RUR03560.1 Na+/H+ antiporter NhaC family protein [Labedella endophytica]